MAVIHLGVCILMGDPPFHITIDAINPKIAPTISGLVLLDDPGAGGYNLRTAGSDSLPANRYLH
jgi:hypothetical protein